MDAEGVKLRRVREREGEKKTEHFAIWCTNNILAHIRARRRIKCGSLMTLLYNIYDTICVGSFIFIQYYIRYTYSVCVVDMFACIIIYTKECCTTQTYVLYTRIYS